MAFEHWWLLFPALLDSDAGGTCGALQQHHKPQISFSFSFVKHAKSNFPWIESLAVGPAPFFSLLSFPPFFVFLTALLVSPSLSLPSPSLFPTASSIKLDTLGNSCLLSAACRWFYLPPRDGFSRAAASTEVRRLPALALTCIPTLKIMDTMENQWRICNFIPFIASYCITPWPSDT